MNVMPGSLVRRCFGLSSPSRVRADLNSFNDSNSVLITDDDLILIGQQFTGPHPVNAGESLTYYRIFVQGFCGFAALSFLERHTELIQECSE